MTPDSAKTLAEQHGLIFVEDWVYAGSARYPRPEVPILIQVILDAFNRGAASKQAQIDALMLEYCPEDMSKEQFEAWASHQKACVGG